MIKNRRPETTGADRGGGDCGAERQNDRRADVGSEAADGEDEGEEHPDEQEGGSGSRLRKPRHEARQRRAGAGDDQHRQQRLELVPIP